MHGNVIHLIQGTRTFHNTAAECPMSTRIPFSNPAKVLYSGESGDLLDLGNSHRRGYLPRQSVLRSGKKSAGLHYTFNGRWLPSSNSIEGDGEIIIYPFLPSPPYSSTLLLHQSFLLHKYPTTYRTHFQTGPAQIYSSGEPTHSHPRN